jgi:hypothetical protein
MSLHRDTYTNCDSAVETCTDTEVAPHTAASPDAAMIGTVISDPPSPRLYRKSSRGGWRDKAVIGAA